MIIPMDNGEGDFDDRMDWWATSIQRLSNNTPPSDVEFDEVGRVVYRLEVAERLRLIDLIGLDVDRYGN